MGIREQFAFTTREMAELLAHEQAAGRSALLLSTCNRCELYWSGAYDYESWFRDLARARGLTLSGELARLDGADAVRHLFTVTAGLDSQILGETEILGQVRRAYDAARAAGTTTREMDAIFSAALATGRRVRHETMLGRHPSSVSSAAVSLVLTEWTEGFRDRPVVVLGAGEAAEGVLRSLHLHGARKRRAGQPEPRARRDAGRRDGAPRRMAGNGFPSWPPRPTCSSSQPQPRGRSCQRRSSPPRWPAASTDPS